MDFLPLITQLLSLTATVALIWLVVRAFRKHPGWGFAVLLLSPISATVFGLKYWETEKKPFLAYIASFCLAVSTGMYLFISWGGADVIRSAHTVHQGIQSQNLEAGDAAGFMKANLNFIENANAGQMKQEDPALAVVPDTAEADESENPAQASADNETTEQQAEKKPKRVRTRLTYIPIQVSDAGKYVGHTVKVKRRNVPEKEYRLTGASGQHLEFSQRMGAGTFSFQYRASDIEKIRVLTKQPY